MMLRLEKTEGVYGPTLQGEGMNIGQMVSFVRFYGCDFRCKWCDTPFSLGKDKGGEFIAVKAEEIVRQLNVIGCRNVVLSGGNPLIQPKKEFDRLIELLKKDHYWIQVETQGSVYPSDFTAIKVDYWSISPKLPSAGENEYQNWKAVDFFLNLACSQNVQFKFVVGNRTDYEYLKTRLQMFRPFPAPVILQPEGQQLQGGNFNYEQYAVSLQHLHKLVADDWSFWKYYTVRVLPQFHKLIWQLKRGV